MIRKHIFKWMTPLILLSLLLAGCGFFSPNAEPTPTPFPENDSEGEDPFIGIPNPASFYCQEMGYELELRDTDQGTEGICVFPDSSECEEWEFLSGGCSVEWTFCQRQGYIIQPGEDTGICSFPDGSTCPEYDFFIGDCLPPQ